MEKEVFLLRRMNKGYQLWDINGEELFATSYQSHAYHRLSSVACDIATGEDDFLRAKKSYEKVTGQGQAFEDGYKFALKSKKDKIYTLQEVRQIITFVLRRSNNKTKTPGILKQISSYHPPVKEEDYAIWEVYVDVSYTGGVLKLITEDGFVQIKVKKRI